VRGLQGEELMGDIYRLTWEMVRQRELVKYMNADPLFYSNTTQTVPNSRIPHEDWYELSKETDDPWDQYHQLCAWAKADEQFVRNVRLDKAVSEPIWVPVEEEGDRRAYDVGRDAMLASRPGTVVERGTVDPTDPAHLRDAGYFECCEMWGGHDEHCPDGN
jgi:hypothetical protein